MTVFAFNSSAGRITNIVPPPPSQISIVNNGNAFGAVQSSDTFNAFLTTQSNGGTFDTTGADLLIIACAGVDIDSNFSSGNFRDTLAAIPTSNVYQRVFVPSIGVAANVQANILYSFPVQTGPNAGFQITSSVANFISLAAIGLKGAFQATPTIQGFNTSDNAASLSLATPLTINARGIVVSVLGNALPVPTTVITPPATYGSAIAMFLAGSNYGTALAWKIGDFTTENPLWTLSFAAILRLGDVFFATQVQ